MLQKIFQQRSLIAKIFQLPIHWIYTVVNGSEQARQAKEETKEEVLTMLGIAKLRLVQLLHGPEPWPWSLHAA